MHSFCIRNITVKVPSGWADINKRNLLWLAKRFPYQPTNGMAIDFFWHALNLPANPRLQLAIARNIITSKKLNLAWKNDIAIEFGEENFFEQQILQAIQDMDNFSFLHKEFELSNLLIPSFRIGFKKYYGPMERLCNLTADEFKHAELFLVNFLNEKEEKWLFLLLATLWREKSKTPTDKDNRIQFSEFSLEKRAEKFKRLPHHLKIACMINYIGMRTAYINEPTSKIIFSKDKSDGGDAQDFNIVLMRIAENHTFGSFENTKNTLIHDIVEHLADMKIRNEQTANH